MPPNDKSKYIGFTENVKKKDVLWHCYRLKVFEKVKRRLDKVGITFTVEQTTEREAGTRRFAHVTNVWIVRVPDVEQDKLAEILRSCLSKAAAIRRKTDERKGFAQIKRTYRSS